MNIAQIEKTVQDVLQNFSPETFIYDLLLAYDKPKSSITRLQKGNLNLSKIPGEVMWKNNLLFRSVSKADLHKEIDHLRKSNQVIKYNLRFVVVTDYTTLLAVDTRTSDTLDIPIIDLPKYCDFFLPWAGQEKRRVHNESAADIKAAYRMARLYDEICKDNPDMTASDRHSLNVFLSRLLFCFFAEDTAIFPDGIFTRSIASHTEEDGSDLNSYLDKLFEVMNTEQRATYPVYLQAFPYVNGGLFTDTHAAPKFSRQSRKIVIECGELDWSEINPDIFGSMIQAVVHPDHRSGMGMHYTSVTNIMKVIEPIFLTEFREVFEENQDNSKGLEKLLERLYNIKIFDPACGSGNFLIISYKELRKLEIQIYQRLQEINIQRKIFLPKIRLTQFYGIELDDFAHEVAILSLWLAEHQMNIKFKNNFGQVVPPLPLKESGQIVCGNAARLDWDKVCPKDDKSEIFVLGNPPYLGARNQTTDQKRDIEIVLGTIKGFNNLDYIGCWFYKASAYIRDSSAKCAFVATNSICQGEQVGLLWPHIFVQELEINFAHRSFKWENNAKHNAAVTVVIIGLRNKATARKYLFSSTSLELVENISPYLTAGKNIIVFKTNESISGLPVMCFGSMANDGGNLFLSREEVNKILRADPLAKKFIRRIYGADEFIGSYERYCLWINDSEKEFANDMDFIRNRVDLVRKHRLNSNRPATNKLADLPHRFGEIRHKETSSIIIPSVSSEHREYIPIGFLDAETIISNLAYAIYYAEPWIFTVISSKMHNVWVRAVAGRLEQRIRYSVGLCYNTFPIPELSDKQKHTLTTHAFNVLAERERHPEKTIAQLYDPDKMPAQLLQAHQDLDVAVERSYRSKPFTSDEERLEYLLDLYEQMTRDVKLQKETIYA